MNAVKDLRSPQARAIAYLRSPQAIRERCGLLFDRACADQLPHFRCDLTRLNAVADTVIQVMRETYPDAEVPFHSRWRHFEVGGSSRLEAFDTQLQSVDRLERARIKLDLAVVSVLLDAGAGRDWRYTEPQTGLELSRSEGLAIASFYLFCNGAFSSDAEQPWQVDAAGLRQLTLAQLADGFQVRADNPLVGLEGRLHLLHALGEALERSPRLFGTRPARPGHLVDNLLSHTELGHAELGDAKSSSGSAPSVSATSVLAAVLEGFSSIWPGRIVLWGVNLGDVWPHPSLPEESPGDNLVPFHKLSQWLTYSLLEPLQEAGFEITGLNQLTGLPEYRNGGLFLDLGVLQPKHPDLAQASYSPSSSVIVEWRALTVVLLDQVADRIRQHLGLDASQLPLVCVLQGGTWSAGRKVARDRRPGGVPPIQIDSDGTVF